MIIESLSHWSFDYRYQTISSVKLCSFGECLLALFLTHKDSYFVIFEHVRFKMVDLIYLPWDLCLLLAVINR